MMKSERTGATSKGELIAVGRTAEVFAWGNSHVLKLYHPLWRIENIEYEARIGRAVWSAGVAAPQVGDIVEVEGRRGLIYERIDGPDMASVMFAEPGRAKELAILFAQLHASLHQSGPADLPLQRKRLGGQIERSSPSPLDEERKKYALDALAALPDGTSICHGDLHPGNVIMSPLGPCIIDWENATCGSPLADVARASVLLLNGYLSYGPAADGGPLFAAISLFRDTYLEEYVALTGADPTLIARWHVPVAAARLDEGIEVEETALLAMCAPPGSTTLQPG